MLLSVTSSKSERFGHLISSVQTRPVIVVMIDGVVFRSLDRNLDEQGGVTEIFRDDWDEVDPWPAMATLETTDPGSSSVDSPSPDQVDYIDC